MLLRKGSSFGVVDRLRRTIVVGAMLLAGTGPTAAAHIPPAGSPLANRDHPRIWITRATIPALREKLGGPFRSEYQQFVSYLDSLFPITRTEDEWEDHILNYAFVYRVGPVPGIAYGRPVQEYGDHARQLLLSVVATPGRPDGGSYWPAVAYDWLFPILSAGERFQVWTYTRTVNTEQSSIKDPWDDRSSRTVQRRVLAGLAFWGDGLDDQQASQLADEYTAHVVNGGLLDAATFIAADDGGVSEGFSYAARGGESSTLENLLKILEGWRTANGLDREEVYSGANATALRYFPQWVAYLIRPHAAPDPSRAGGFEYFPYKTHNMDADQPISAKGTLRTILGALRLYKDIDPQMAALSEWLLRNRVGQVGASGSDGRERALLAHFIFGEKGIEPRSPAELGLPATRAFDGLGWLAMRTGFTQSTDSMVTFIASPWWRSGFSNNNQNSFTIDRRGPLALNSGHRTHHAYANSTWAHNTIVFVPSTMPERPVDGYDQGGQRRSFKPPVTNVSMLTSGSIYDLGGIKRLQAADSASGRDFDYVLGDATRAYNGPANADTIAQNSPRVVLFTRQLVYFRPTSPAESDRLVIFDRTESVSPVYEKRWLLHTPGEPEVDGAGVLEAEGRSVYRGAGLVTATNTANGSAGRLFSRTLLPAERRIIKIGGPGHEFENLYGINDPSNGFDPGDERTAQYVGTYRVEVIPAVPSTRDLFLHVLEASDAGTTSPTPAALVQGEGLVGARVGQRIAVFSRTEEPVRTGDVVIDRAGTYRVLLCDLVPELEYEIESSTGSVRQTSSAAGLLYVDVAARDRARLVIRATSVPSLPLAIR